MKGLIIFSLLLQYGVTMVFFIINDGFYTKKRHIYRDLIPFYWFYLFLKNVFILSLGKWKDLE